jgi:hypothetical protein
MNLPPAPPPSDPQQPQPPTPPPGPPFGPPPQPWPGQGAPYKSGRGPKSLFGAVVLLVVVAISVGATILFMRSQSGGSGNVNPTPGTQIAPAIASASDGRPVSVIAEDPSCARWSPIYNTLAAKEKNGWEKRNPSIPAAQWSPDQRTEFEAVGTAMRNAADEIIKLANQTPHRVVRELYEQVIAYARAYANSLPTYTESDDHLAGVVVTASWAIAAACDAITYGSPAVRGPDVPPANAPSKIAAVDDTANPQLLLATPDPICADWENLGSRFDDETVDWRTKTDVNLPVSEWTPEQKAVYDAVAPVMTRFADDADKLAKRSNNGITQDIAAFAGQYIRAYVGSLSTYTPADNYLVVTGLRSIGMLTAACAAAVR